MDSSNAEKAWESWRYSDDAMLVSPGIPNRESFVSGRASRDAEVAELTAIEQRLTDHIVQLAAERDSALRALAESRARYGDLEVQLAEAQAVIAKARKHLDIVFGENSVHMSTMRRILDSAPSVVLEDRDREVAARAVDKFAADLREWYPEDVFPKPTDEDYHDLHVALARTNITLDRFSADLMHRAAGIAEQEAAAIRKGDTNA